MQSPQLRGKEVVATYVLLSLRVAERAFPLLIPKLGGATAVPTLHLSTAFSDWRERAPRNKAVIDGAKSRDEADQIDSSRL